MKAIRVRYIPATDHRSVRVCADDGDGNRMIVSRHLPELEKLDGSRLARCVCLMFVEKMGWGGDWAQGGYKNDNFFTCYKS